jgi:hypothetical protein
MTLGFGCPVWYRLLRGYNLGCEACEGTNRLIISLARDVSDLRRRVEEIAKGGSEAPRVDTEAEKKAEEEAAERERQKAEAFLRMRAEKGKSDEVDDEDVEFLSGAWMNG